MSNVMESNKPKFSKMSLRFVIPLVLFYLIVGALLIWLNEQATTIASYVLAVILAALGFWFIFSYFRSDLEKRTAGTDLASGLISLLSGVVLALSPTSLKEILPAVWGLSLVFGGFLKIQYAFDEKSVGVKRWWIMLIFAALSLAIGTLALLRANVFGGSIGNPIIGIFMIAEAVLDIVTFFLIKSGLKKQTSANEDAKLSETAAEPDQEEGPAPQQDESPAGQ